MSPILLLLYMGMITILVNSIHALHRNFVALPSLCHFINRCYAGEDTRMPLHTLMYPSPRPMTAQQQKKLPMPWKHLRKCNLWSLGLFYIFLPNGFRFHIADSLYNPRPVACWKSRSPCFFKWNLQPLIGLQSGWFASRKSLLEWTDVISFPNCGWWLPRIRTCLHATIYSMTTACPYPWEWWPRILGNRFTRLLESTVGAVGKK